MKLIIQRRGFYEHCTDPQRRCYNGVYFSSEWRWSEWADFHSTTENRAEDDLKFWRELNDYATKGSTRMKLQYRIKPQPERKSNETTTQARNSDSASVEEGSSEHRNDVQ